MNKINLNISTINILNFLIIILPLSMILGNLAINIEVILISIIGLFYYRKSFNGLKKNKLILLVISFFVYIILTTLINYYLGEKTSLLKAFLFLRFLIFTIILSFMVDNNELRFKYLFLSCIIFSTLVSLDVIFQYHTGQNFFGYKGNDYHNSGVFAEELISGSFIQKLLVLGIFSIYFLLENKISSRIFIFLLLLIGTVGTIYSGNRIPVLSIFLFLVLAVFLCKEFRLPIIACLIISIVLLINLVNTNKYFESNYNSFLSNAKLLLSKISTELPKDYPELKENTIFHNEYLKGSKVHLKYYTGGIASGHAVIYVTALDIWNDKPIIGNGIKSYRNKCTKKIHLPNRVCTSHPHHYYIEILTDTGLIGFILFIIFLTIIIIKKLLLILNIKNNKERLMFIGLILALAIEMFPAKSTGSFFSTGSAIYIFLLLGLLINLKSKIKN